MIEWNDGLSLGVKSIDDDHKKLLAIINELSLAVSNDRAKDIIEDIFQKLEKYAVEHFHKEESLLKKSDFEDLAEHIAGHQAFALKIPELKAKLLKNDAQAQEVVLFLIDWLFEHIIEEDFLAINSLGEYQSQKEIPLKSTLLQRTIKHITDTFSFSKRLLISSVIPLIGMFFLISYILFNNYYKNEDMLKTSSMTNILSSINNLAHVIQVERGLSSGLLSSKEDKFQSNLQKQREIVDNEIKLFDDKIKTVDKQKIIVINSYIKRFITDISSLKDFRKKVDTKNISQNILLQYYTNMIKNILDIAPKIARDNPNLEISSSIETLSSLLYYKETLGLKRAVATIIIEHKGIHKEEFYNFIQLLSTQSIYLDKFEQTATKSQEKSLSLIRKSPFALNINLYQNNIQEHNFLELKSEIWFEIMTNHINEIKTFENKLLAEIDMHIKNILLKNKENLFLWLIYTTIIFISTAFIIYIFEKSSKTEIYKFTDAMNYLAKGGRDLRLEKPHKEDEIAQMYASYEVARQKLLKGDFYMQLYLHKKEMELQKQEIENQKLEEMASIDPLTSCVNRRKFEELSNLELSRSIRYKSDLSFLMLDIDHFKAVNDTYGHGVGDEVLVHFSGVCLEMARNLDIVARIGGEEFVVMLPQTNSEGAFIFAERFRKSISNAEVVVEKQTIRYSVSIGIAILDDTTKDVKMILEKADKALYEAKDTGRNKTVVSSS